MCLNFRRHVLTILQKADGRLKMTNILDSKNAFIGLFIPCSASRVSEEKFNSCAVHQVISQRVRCPFKKTTLLFNSDFTDAYLMYLWVGKYPPEEERKYLFNRNSSLLSKLPMCFPLRSYWLGCRKPTDGKYVEYFELVIWPRWGRKQRNSYLYSSMGM